MQHASLFYVMFDSKIVSPLFKEWVQALEWNVKHLLLCGEVCHITRIREVL